MALTLNGSTGISGIAGSAGTPALQGNNDTNTGYFFAADTLGLSTAGSERLRIDSSGNLGLGTTSPTDTGGYGRALDITGGASGAAIYLRSANGDTGQISLGSGDLTIRTRQADPIIFNTNNAERLRITSGGLLLLGSATSDLSGNHRFISVGSRHAFQYGGSTGTYLSFIMGSADGDVTLETSARSGGYPPLVLKVGGSERLRIDSDGDLWFGLTPVTHHNNRHVFFHNVSDNLISITAGSSATAGIVFGDSAANTTANYEGYIAYYNVNDSLYLYTDQGNKGLELKKSGDVHVINGNLVLADTHGIDFSATGAGNATSSESELLDDYEEGNHLVTDPGGNWTIGTGSGAYKYIRYIKIGNQCTVMGQVYCGAGSGVLKFTLPFAAGFNGATIGGAAQDLAYTNGAVRLYQWDVPDNVVTASMMTYNGQTYSQINVTLDNANSSTLDGDNGAYVSYSLTYPTA